MANKELLKKEYVKVLTDKATSYKEKMIELRKNGANDEAVFEQIKLNVVNIFSQMFSVSYNFTFNGGKNPKLEKFRELNKDEYELLLDVYLSFFESIPQSWKEKAEKDKQHGMDEEYHKEMLKLEALEEVKEIFLELHKKYE